MSEERNDHPEPEDQEGQESEGPEAGGRAAAGDVTAALKQEEDAFEEGEAG